MQLTNSSAGSSTSASATSPVLQVGYTENLTKNLQLSIGVLQYSSGLSLSHSSTPTTNSLQETQTAIGDSVTLGTTFTTSDFGVQSWTASGTCCVAGMFLDNRVEVTQVGERTVNIEEIVTPAGAGNTEAELKAPTVISISLPLLTKLAFCLARLCACPMSLLISFRQAQSLPTDLFFCWIFLLDFFQRKKQTESKNRKQKQTCFFQKKKQKAKKFVSYNIPAVEH